MLWSAKSACSLTFVWYLNQVGLLDDYLASGASPHEYRGTRYLKSDAFARGRSRMPDDFRIIHVIRDPYQRAVSSYRHVLATGLADKRFVTFGDVRLDRSSGFSFASYLDFLDTVDVSSTNLHHRQQFHPIERIKRADRVVNISNGDFHAALNHIERDLGLRHTDFGGLQPVLGREENRRARTVAFDTGNTSSLPLNAAAARGDAPWPHYDQFLNAAVRGRIARLYAVDFEAFGPYLQSFPESLPG